MVNMHHSSAIILTAGMLLFAGCNSAPKDGVVATVNGHPIQQTEVDKIYKQQLASSGQAEPSLDQANSLKLNILHELITEEIVEQRAAKENLTATDAEVDGKLAEMKAPYTEEQFNAQLTASGRTLDSLKHDLRRSLTINKLLNKEINARITVTDADVTKYYNDHKAEFNLLETQYHLAQIQVTGLAAQQAGNLQNNKATNDAEARKKIQALKNRIDAGEDFGMLAMNFSENTQTAPNQGDMGFIPESTMKADPAVYGQVIRLKPGQSTDILPLLDQRGGRPVGYAIYKLISREAAGQRDLGDPAVQQSIRQQLHDSRSQLLKAAYFEMLLDQSKVQNFLAEQIFKNTK